MAAPTVLYRKEDEKLDAAVDHVEVKDPETLDTANVDYSGFVQKTDPVEIKLVRKLDRYIMVSTSLEFGLTSSHLSGRCTGSTTLTGMPSL